MKSKWILFTGIILLIVGIILKKITSLGLEAILLIIVGVLFKTYYIAGKAKSGIYKPGKELIFLFVGLILFLTGTYFESQLISIYSKILIFSGLSLKVIFIIMFIANVKNAKNTSG